MSGVVKARDYLGLGELMPWNWCGVDSGNRNKKGNEQSEAVYEKIGIIDKALIQ